MVNTTTLRAYLDDLAALLKAGDTTKVITHCHYILQHYPQNVAAYRLLARALLDRGQRDGIAAYYDEALEVFQRVLSVLPNDVIAHREIGRIRRLKSQIDRAIWHMERAYEQEPGDTDVQETLRQLYAQQTGGKTPVKIQLTRGALARQYINAQLHNQALIELRTALEETPDRLDLLVLQAETLWETQHPIEAGEMAMRILKKLPYCLSANRIMARLWLDNERPTDAQPFLERIEAVDPYAAREVLYPDSRAADMNVLPRLDYDVQGQAEMSSEMPEWLADLGEAEVAEPPPDQVQPFALDREPSQPPEAPADAVSEDSFADWLGAMSDTDEPGESGVGDEWLSDGVLQGWDDDAATESPPAVPGEDSDWLQEAAGSPEQAEAEKTEDGGIDAGALGVESPDWMSGTPDFESPDDVPGWLAGTPETPAFSAESDAEQATDDDWLSAARDKSAPSPPETPVLDSDFTYWHGDSILHQEDEPQTEPDVPTPLQAEQSPPVDDLPEMGSDDEWTYDEAPSVPDADDDTVEAPGETTDRRQFSSGFTDLLAGESERRVPDAGQEDEQGEVAPPAWLSDFADSEVWAQTAGEDAEQDGDAESESLSMDEFLPRASEEDILAAILGGGAETPQPPTGDEVPDTSEDAVSDTMIDESPDEGEPDADTDQGWDWSFAEEYTDDQAFMPELDEESDIFSESAGEMADRDLPPVEPEPDLHPAPDPVSEVQPAPPAEPADELADLPSDEALDWMLDPELDFFAPAAEQLADLTAEETGDDEAVDEPAMTPAPESEDAEEGDWLGGLDALDAGGIEEISVTPDPSDDEFVPGIASAQPDAEQDWPDVVDDQIMPELDDLVADDEAAEPADIIPEWLLDAAPGSDAEDVPDVFPLESAPLVQADEPVEEPDVLRPVDVPESTPDDIAAVWAAEEAGDQADPAADDMDLPQLDMSPEEEQPMSDADDKRDEHDDMLSQPYDPFEEGSPEDVPHYASARDTGVLQPDELPAWMTAFTGEEMPPEPEDEPEDDADMLALEADADADQPDSLDLSPEEDGDEEDIAAVTESMKDLVTDADDIQDEGDYDTEDLYDDEVDEDGMPSWLRRITQSEADKLDDSLFGEPDIYSSSAEESGVLQPGTEDDWLQTMGEQTDEDDAAAALDAILFGDDEDDDTFETTEAAGVGADRDEEQAVFDSAAAFGALAFDETADEQDAEQVDLDLDALFAEEPSPDAEEVLDLEAMLFGAEMSASEPEAEQPVETDEQAEEDLDLEAMLFGAEMSASEPEAKQPAEEQEQDDDDGAIFAVLFDETEPSGETDLSVESEGPELEFDFEPAEPLTMADDQFAEPDNIAHTKEAESETITDSFLDEDVPSDSDEDFAFEDDVLPVWLRRPRESELPGDSLDTGQDSAASQAPEWLRDVFEEDGDGDDGDLDFD